MSMNARVRLYHPFKRFPTEQHRIEKRLPIQPIDVLFEGQRDLIRDLGQFHSWFSIALDQFEDAPERGLLLTGDEMGADAVGVDGVSLLLQTDERVLVDVVGGDDDKLAHPVEVRPGLGDFVEHRSRRHGQVGQIPGVDPDAARAVAAFVQRQRHGGEVQQPALFHVVRVDEGEKVGRKRHGVSDERRQFRFVGRGGVGAENLGH